MPSRVALSGVACAVAAAVLLSGCFGIGEKKSESKKTPQRAHTTPKTARGVGSPPTRAAQAPYGPASAAAAAGAGIIPVTLGVKRTKLGRILVDGGGRTLYLFARDSGRKSTCYGECADIWPAVTTTTDPIAGSGVSIRHLGTEERRDRTIGVTYYGHPLYYYAFDEAAGQIHGQGVDDFGALWYAVTPRGRAVLARRR
jgi:predicted lipoprotein with Yx(FWY)xxD motif